jgi:hypothetical protein
MRIGGFEDYSSYLQNYRVPAIPSVSLEEVRRQDEQRKASDLLQGTGVSAQPSAVSSAPRKDALLEDISLTFNRNDDFGFIGRESDLALLDAEAVVSETRKDDILSQYSYFAGAKSGSLVDNADGLVIAKVY